MKSALSLFCLFKTFFIFIATVKGECFYLLGCSVVLSEFNVIFVMDFMVLLLDYPKLCSMLFVSNIFRVVLSVLASRLS